MNLIVGLGNIGEKYQNTRHNIGFLVVDAMTKSLNTANIDNTNFQSTLEKSGYNLFAKPKTYMNNSGIAVFNIKEYYKIELDNIIVIHDDLDLPFGTIRFKKGGGHGGHNGLRSLDSHLGKDYIRVRVGIGKPQDKDEVVNYVLNDFSKVELGIIEKELIPHIIEAIKTILSDGLEVTKTKYTKK